MINDTRLGSALRTEPNFCSVLARRHPGSEAEFSAAIEQQLKVAVCGKAKACE